MNRIFYVAKAVLLGLLATQIIATLHVYLSNADLYRTVTTLTEAGLSRYPQPTGDAYSQRIWTRFFRGGLLYVKSWCGAIYFLCCLRLGLGLHLRPKQGPSDADCTPVAGCRRGSKQSGLLPKEFFTHPEKVLRQFSAETDRHAFFRQATIFCLPLGFPITLKDVKP